MHLLRFVFLTTLILTTVVGKAKTESEQPNILWIYVEDLNPFFSCYGTTINPAPAIDGLAEKGVLFEKAFTPAPVCSPARSAIITGTMPTTYGTHNHHSSRTVEDAIFLPNGTQTIPELFRERGYFTFNHGKDDYNFIYDRKDLYSDSIQVDFWYTFAGTGDWMDSLSVDRPFFGQVQLSGGKLSLNQTYDRNREMITPIDRSLVKLPPYYPNIPAVHEDWARHFDAARMTDVQVNQLLTKLGSKGLLNNTYIFFFTDHGYKGMRHKQFLYDGGIQIPLIVAYYGDQGEITAETRRDDLVSGIDIGPTSLVLAGIPIPSYMEGMDVFSKDYGRDHIVATRDRCDFSIDRIRAVRTEKYKYIKNFMPERSYTQPSYRDRRVEWTSIEEAYKKGELNKIQAKYWLPGKPEEELYDLENDPHEIYNLAKDSKYSDVLIKHRELLRDWSESYGDQGEVPQNLFSLKFMLDRWGDRCVNPEFEAAKNLRIPNTPARKIKD